MTQGIVVLYEGPAISIKVQREEITQPRGPAKILIIFVREAFAANESPLPKINLAIEFATITAI